MLFSLLYLNLRRLLATGHHPEGGRDIELLVLRHQVKVLRRQVKEVHLRRSDRVLLAAASRTLPRLLWLVHRVARDAASVAPGTGAPKVDVQQEERQVRTAPAGRPDDGPHPPPGKGEPPVGYQRIRGELLGFGIPLGDVSSGDPSTSGPRPGSAARTDVEEFLSIATPGFDSGRARSGGTGRPCAGSNGPQG
jgi:putative transposase